MKSLHRLLCCALTVMLSSTCWARIGETLEECIARYGQPTFGPDPFTGIDTQPASMHGVARELTDTQIYRFDKDPLVIKVVIHKGSAHMIYFYCPTENLGEQGLHAILEKNMGDFEAYHGDWTAQGAPLYCQVTTASKNNPAFSPAVLHLAGLRNINNWDDERICTSGSGVTAIIGGDRSSVLFITPQMVEALREAEAKLRAKNKTAIEEQNKEKLKTLENF